MPAGLDEIIKETGAILNDKNQTIIDKFNNTVTGTVLEDSTKYLAKLLNLKEYGKKIFADVRAAWWMILM